MRFVLSGVLIAVVLSASGCDSHGGLPEADYKRAKSALESALAAWQKGEPAKKWAVKNAKVRFLDDAWAQKQKLLEYEILEIRANKDKAPEAIVRLKTRSAKGVELEREALYGIDLRRSDQISIGRDPMY